jgi:DNA-binding NarL/FixJ family response regulator
MGKIKERYRLFIVDDHPVVRQGLTQFLNEEDDLVICGEAEDISTAITNIDKYRPDLVITDITLDDGNGLDLISEIKSRFKIPVLVLSMHDEKFYAERALHAGAKGYIMKQEPMAVLLNALHEILKGGIYLNPEIKDILLNKLLSPKSPMNTGIDRLSNREIEILKKIGDGVNNRHIASQLCLSVRTIETYKKRIIEKLCLSNASNLIQYAIQWRKHEGENL